MSFKKTNKKYFVNKTTEDYALIDKAVDIVEEFKEKGYTCKEMSEIMNLTNNTIYQFNCVELAGRKIIDKIIKAKEVYFKGNIPDRKIKDFRKQTIILRKQTIKAIDKFFTENNIQVKNKKLYLDRMLNIGLSKLEREVK